MNKKSGCALRIVLGGYLTYLGIRILSEMIQQRPSNMTLMSVLAVVFILVGVAYAGNAICKTFEIDIKKQIAKMIAKRKAEQKRKAEEAAAAKEMSQVTESGFRGKNSIRRKNGDYNRIRGNTGRRNKS